MLDPEFIQTLFISNVHPDITTCTCKDWMYEYENL